MADYLRVPIINSNHEILMKRQSSKVPVQIRDLIEPEITIFMLNLPFPSDFQSLTLFFQSIDSQLKITKCYSIKNHELKSIHESPAFIPVGSFLFVQFETPRDLDLIFNSDLSNVEWNLPKNLGIQRWKQIHSAKRPSFETLTPILDNVIRKYDAIIESSQAELKNISNVPDEDGWVKVTRTHRNNTNLNNGISVTATSLLDAQNYAIQAEKKQKNFVDFYRFQMRQAKRDKLVELRAKFEEDKKKIAEMKSRRVFKPY